jgi:hypothetical protein
VILALASSCLNEFSSRVGLSAMVYALAVAMG